MTKEKYTRLKRGKEEKRGVTHSLWWEKHYRSRVAYDSMEIRDGV